MNPTSHLKFFKLDLIKRSLCALFFSISVAIKDLKIIEEKEEALMALGNLAYNIG